MARTQNEAGITVSNTGSVSSQRTSFRAGGEAYLGFELEFDVLTPVTYEIRGSLGRTTTGSPLDVDDRAVVDLRGPNNNFEVFREFTGPGSFSDSGQLAVGHYLLRANAVCISRTNDPAGAAVSCERTYAVDFFVGDPAPPVVITTGPSGLVRSREARLGFATVGEGSPGAFECSLDGGAFATCSSPQLYPGLADGEHVFQVRFRPSGREPGEVTERRFTVDATPPVVSFDGAPSGPGHPPDVEVGFGSSEPDGAGFRCSLDGGPGFDCASPQRLIGLADGPHSLAVVASDRAGNESDLAVAEWTVGAGATGAPGAPPAPVSVCAGGGSEVKFGSIRLVARSPDACFVPGEFEGRRVKISSGVVSLNGIRLVPNFGSRIIVEERSGDGRVRVDGPLGVGFGSLPLMSLDRLDLNGLVSASARINKEIQFIEGVVGLAGMKGVPGVQVEFSDENGGSTKVTFRVTVPKAAFSRLPGAEGLTVEVAPTFSNDRGVTGAGRIKVAQAYMFGRFKVKDLDLFLDLGTNTFEGSAGLAWTPERPGLAQETVTLAVGLGTPDSKNPACGVFRKLGLVGSNLQKHVGEGIFLQRAGGLFDCVAGAGGGALWRLTANAGLSFGPRIAIGTFEAEAATIDARYILSIPGEGNPSQASFESEGVGRIVEIPIAKLTAKFTLPFHVDHTAVIDHTYFGGYGLKLESRSFYVGLNGFSVHFGGRAVFWGLDASANAAISEKGFAVCVGDTGQQVGFGFLWRGPLQEPMNRTCDVGPYLTAGPASARAASVGARTFTVKPGTRLKALAASGGGAPPKVRLTSPNGRTFKTPRGKGAINDDRLLLFQDQRTSTTHIALKDPAPGRWSLQTMPGSPPLKQLRSADGLPPVTIKARITGKGSTRTLSWTATNLNSQRLELTETGRSTDQSRRVTTTTRTRGKVRFTPDPALGRKRQIQAVIVRNGLPRSTSTVARYQITPPRRPGKATRPRLKSRTITWTRAPNASRYDIVITHPDRTTTTHATRRSALNLPTPPRSAITIQILAYNSLGQPGPTAKHVLRPSR